MTRNLTSSKPRRRYPEVFEGGQQLLEDLAHRLFHRPPNDDQPGRLTLRRLGEELGWTDTQMQLALAELQNNFEYVRRRYKFALQLDIVDASWINPAKALDRIYFFRTPGIEWRPIDWKRPRAKRTPQPQNQPTNQLERKTHE